MQGVRGRGHLPAPAPKGQVQGVRGRGHLPAPAHQEPMQGVLGGASAREPEEQMHGMPRGVGQVDAGWPGGARGSWRVSAAGYDGLMDAHFLPRG